MELTGGTGLAERGKRVRVARESERGRWQVGLRDGPLRDAGERKQAGASWAEVWAVRGGRSELGPRRGESWALVEKEWVGLS